jgi:hypothetical protein
VLPYVYSTDHPAVDVDSVRCLILALFGTSGAVGGQAQL